MYQTIHMMVELAELMHAERLREASAPRPNPGGEDQDAAGRGATMARAACHALARAGAVGLIAVLALASAVSVGWQAAAATGVGDLPEKRVYHVGVADDGTPFTCPLVATETAWRCADDE